MAIFRKAAGYRYDTGFSDAEVFMEYLKEKGAIDPPTEKRISLLPNGVFPMTPVSRHGAREYDGRRPFSARLAA
jgi:hypothetical protein